MNKPRTWLLVALVAFVFECNPAQAQNPCAGQADGAQCPPLGGGDCTIDVCINQICTHRNEPAGSGCLSDGNQCTKDECDGAGACGHPNDPAGTACRDDGNQCTKDECDGAGACGHPNEPAGTTCDDGVANAECKTDACNATGDCGIVNVEDSTLCAADNNACTIDACFDGVCTHDSCLSVGAKCEVGEETGECYERGALCYCSAGPIPKTAAAGDLH